MTGQLSVPLHHVEGVGDIAVLPPPKRHKVKAFGGTYWRCVDCGSAFDHWPLDPEVCPHWFVPLPVVGQMVAHVEKCANCGGTGQTQARPPFAIGWEVCTGACGGSGWVRDQYVRVTEVLPIRVDYTDHGTPAIVVMGEWMASAGKVFYVPADGSLPTEVDLPGAVPGGVALIVEPAECPGVGQPAVAVNGSAYPHCATCGAEVAQAQGQKARARQGDVWASVRRHAVRPVPVSAPSAPYTESDE